MYELIDETQHGIENGAYLITRSEPSFASGRSLVFRLHSLEQALEILRVLNRPRDNDDLRCPTCGKEVSREAPFCCEVSDAAA